jgi:hypothetical protein
MANQGSTSVGSTLAVVAAVACSFFPRAAVGQPGLEPGPDRATGLDSRKAPDKSEITFVGYQTLPGGRGMVFVELSDPVTVEVSRAGQVIEYKLVGATVPLKNNKNPLLLREFGSSALSAVLVPDKKGVRLVITLRSAVSPTHRMVARGKGATLEIELPAAASK